MDADAVNDAFDAMSDARRRAVTMVASGGAVLAPEDFDRNETDATTTTTTTTATATPAAHRGRMTGETEEDYASMRRALDALRERSKETIAAAGGGGDDDERPASASAARDGGATRATRATIATAYEMVETFASRGAVTTAKFSKVGEHCLATGGDRLGAVSVRRDAGKRGGGVGDDGGKGARGGGRGIRLESERWTLVDGWEDGSVEDVERDAHL